MNSYSMKVHDVVSLCLLIRLILRDLVKCVVHSLHGVLVCQEGLHVSIHVPKPDN